MKIIKYFIVFIGIFSSSMVGCSNEVKNEENEIIVKKRVGEENKYEQHDKITDKTAVINVNDIMSNTSWEIIEVQMAHPPYYKFYFENKDEQSESNQLIYSLWITPNKDKIELVINGEGKYVRLDKEKSAQLFEILTGERVK